MISINLNKHSLISVAAFFFFIVQFSCRDKKNNINPDIIARDTTISAKESYSELFLDSLAVENFIDKETTKEETAAYLRNFYNSRNYSFAWFDEDGLTEHAQLFWDEHNNVIRASSDSMIYDIELHSILDSLLNDSTYKLIQTKLDETELRFTKHIFEYVQFAYTGRVDPEEVQWHIPRRKLNPSVIIDSFISRSSIQWKPVSSSFRKLQKELFRLDSIKQKGGWQELPSITRTYAAGSTGNIIKLLKERLKLSGEYKGNDSSGIYSDELSVAIKKTQASFGFIQNGIINNVLLAKLNIPVEERLKQIILNLERMKWMPEEPAKYLQANIPGYTLHAVENGKELITMNIVVGKAVNRTIIFSDELKYVVFSPYWNVPRSIVKNEILPAMNKSKTYLARNNMEVTGYNSGLPVVRQKPGKGNALGRVKFIFPNSYNIYFHDTPSKGLFSRESRAFSHGCVRLEDPLGMAKYLLAGQPEWTEEKIKLAMNSNKEKWVLLEKNVPVFITYFTSWVDKDGLLHFADDIYGHDKKLATHLFQGEK